MVHFYKTKTHNQSINPEKIQKNTVQFHQRKLVISENSWNALKRNRGRTVNHEIFDSKNISWLPLPTKINYVKYFYSWIFSICKIFYFLEVKHYDVKALVERVHCWGRKTNGLPLGFQYLVLHGQSQLGIIQCTTGTCISTFIISCMFVSGALEKLFAVQKNSLVKYFCG